jgi:hypothetical protein
MANTSVSLKDFLEERHLTRKNCGPPLAQARQRLEESRLLKIMRDICAAINRAAGSVTVDEHHYLPPEPVVSSFIFTQGQTEYVMRLELWGPRPSLLFVIRRWRDSSQNRLLRLLYRLLEAEPLSIDVKFTCEIREEEVSEEEIERCFLYLLSGLSRSYIPSFQSCNGGTKDG